MEGMKPKAGWLKKIGRGVRFAFLPVGAWQTTVESFKDLKTTSKAALHTVRAASEPQSKRQTWAEAISRYGVTHQAIVKQVSIRQSIAWICMFFFFVAVNGAIVWRSILPGIGCAAFATIYYLQSSLRLYQIRHRELCSFAEFIARVKREPRELLPLGLPAGWKLR